MADFVDAAISDAVQRESDRQKLIATMCAHMLAIANSGQPQVAEHLDEMIDQLVKQRRPTPAPFFWVIMANDYPAGVATTEADRDRMVAETDAKWRRRWAEDARINPASWHEHVPEERRTNVYVRAYEFRVNKVEQ